MVGVHRMYDLVVVLDGGPPFLNCGLKRRHGAPHLSTPSGRRQVAEVRSGLVIGTTRSAITQAVSGLPHRRTPRRSVVGWLGSGTLRGGVSH